MNLYFHDISDSRWQEAFAEFWQPKYGNAHQKAKPAVTCVLTPGSRRGEHRGSSLN